MKTVTYGIDQFLTIKLIDQLVVNGRNMTLADGNVKWIEIAIIWAMSVGGMVENSQIFDFPDELQWQAEETSGVVEDVD